MTLFSNLFEGVVKISSAEVRWAGKKEREEQEKLIAAVLFSLYVRSLSKE